MIAALALVKPGAKKETSPAGLWRVRAFSMADAVVLLVSFGRAGQGCSAALDILACAGNRIASGQTQQGNQDSNQSEFFHGYSPK